MTSSLRTVLRRVTSQLIRKAAARRPSSPTLETLEQRDNPSGTYTGVVFQDFNANGQFDTTTTVANGGSGTTALAIDRGIGGVTVQAFDGANTLQGTATTLANGTYSLAAAGTGPYRLEFGALPTGFVPGPHGTGVTGNGTSVQFAADGVVGNLNYGAVLPDDFAPNNPTIVAAQSNYGDQQSAPANTRAALISFPYSAGSLPAAAGTTPAPTTVATSAQVGTVHGLGQNRVTGTVYAAAYMKKHAGFGPDGTGAIYQVSSAGAVSLFVDLNAVFGAGTAGVDAHNTANYDTDNGNTGWDAVGKTAFGGLDVSPDGQFVYVMNLTDRSLYKIPTSGPLTNATITRTQLPAPVASMNVTGVTAGTPLGDLRPFAVTFYRGQLYVGAVNSAESTGLASDLHSYVYRVNPATLAFNATPVFQFDNMTYTRGNAEAFTNPALSANWHAWSATFKNEDTSQNPTVGAYTQPMLSGLTFDAAGNLTLGYRDRGGDQFGFFTLDDPTRPGARLEGVAGGEILFAAINVPNNLASGWSLESNGAVVTPGNVNNFAATAGAGNTQGPGGGEFYFQDNHNNTHQETATGALLQLSGHPDVVTSAYDPNAAVRAGGFSWMSTTAGTQTKGYQSYRTTGANDPTQGVTFSKVNGTGELVALLTPPPIEVGNRVWADANGNGIQDATEGGINGLTVHLYNSVGGLIGTTTTAGNGDYYFASTTIPTLVPGQAYSIRLDLPADYAPGGGLNGLTPTAFQTGTNVSTDSNGVASTPTDVRAALTTGGVGASNHTADFGFRAPTLSLGNQVFVDVNNDGSSAGETGIAGVAVQLLFDADNSGTITGAELTPVATQNTVANGLYLFTGLAPGNYQVQLAASNFTGAGVLVGYVSSTGTNGSLTGPFEGAGVPADPDNDADNVDDGNTVGALGGTGVIRSGVITLATGTEPTGENPSNDSGTDNNGNLTLDFGVFQPLQVGNLVWNDANNDGAFAGETGIDGIAVRLFSGATLVASTTTAGGGAYLFTNLTPGTYRVEITPGAGFVSSTGTNGSATGPVEPVAVTNNTNNQDHGTQGVGVISAPTFVLAAPGGSNPDAGAAGAAAANLRQDFGIYQPLSLGNFVWNDANNDGLLNGAEAGINGVVVGLLDAAGNPVLDAANNPTTATTAGGGLYQFNNLIPGTYIVSVLASNFTAGNPLNGLLSSSGTFGSPAGPFEPVTGANSPTNNQDHGSTQVNGSVRTQPVTLAAPGNAANLDTGPSGANSANLRQDFGFTGNTYSLGGSIYYDANNDGVIAGAGEPLIPLTTTITLTGTDFLGNPVNRTITTVTGTYNFTGLLPSDGTGYTLTQTVQPAGYLDGKDTPGTPYGGTAPAAGETITSVVIATTQTNHVGINYNFGELLPASLGDFVWLDVNGNGRQDGGTEVGIDGVTVTLTGTNDRGAVAAATTTTAGGGAYAFTGLRPGTYTVTFGNSTPTTTYTRTTQTAAGSTAANDSNANQGTGAAAPVTLAAGQNDPTIDEGLVLLASVGDTVWYDIDGSGTQNGTEPGVGGVTVLLDYAGTDGVFGTGDDQTGAATQTTTAAGFYLFTNLQPGNYRTRVDATTLPAGLTTQTFDLDGLGTANKADFSLAAGQDRRDVDYGYRGTATLGDTVWYDVDKSGTQNNNEPGIGGVTVGLLWAGRDGTFGTADDVTFPTQTTTGLGKYLFTNLPAGNFRAAVTTATLPAGVTVNTYDLDGGTTTPNSTADTTLTAGQNRTDVDFGYTGTAALGDRVWLDTNGNAAQDGGEPGISGVTVTATWFGPNGTAGGGDDVALTATTGANGIYNFGNLPPGTFLVAVSNVPAGLVQTGDPDATIDGKSTVTLATGETNLLQDFGYRGASSVAGNVYVDLNNDGVFATTETPIPGTTVTLTGADVLGNQVVRTTTTLADGSYAFTNLVPGTYTLTETQPLKYGDGKDTVGSLAGTTGNDVFSGIVIGANQNGTAYNFGERPGTISGIVFYDKNKDGVLDATETPLAGVTVTLRDATGAAVGTPQVTGADGTYLFTNLPAGDYTVTETQPAGYGDPAVGPFAPNARPVTLPPGGSVPNQNFGDTLGSIAGVVYVDINNNGTRDAGEPPIAGVTVTLTGGRTPVTMVTGADGTYLFPDLPGGTYQLVETQPAAYNDGQETVGTAGGTRVPTDTITEIPLPAGVAATTYNFGELSATVSGRSYLDADKNGVFDPAIDRPLAGVLITLTGPGGTRTTTTAADGTYSFTGLRGGDYTITETQPAGLGNSEAPTNVRTVTVPANGTVGNQNFGNTLGSIAGVVYVDINNNGTRDAGEPPIPGVTVTLTGGPAPVTAVTGADGTYLFPNLPAATYQVVETQPAAYSDGRETVGTAGGTLVPADTISAIILGGGVAATTYNFGELGATLSGVSYYDRNWDSVFQPGTDTPLAGIVITLTGPGGTRTTTTAADGSYSFTGLTAGSYTITETQPAGYGNSEAPTNVRSVTVPANGAVGNQNFGNTLGAALSPPPALTPLDFFPPVSATDLSKRQFLSTVDTTTVGGTAPAGATSPAFAAFAPSPNRVPVFATIAEGGLNGMVRVFDFASGAERFRFQPYGDFGGGVRVATADVTGDGTPDIITTPGVGGGPVVKVFDGNTGAEVRAIQAFESSFRGGLQVAAADINGDGQADLVVTPDEGGGPVIRAFDGKTGAVLANFLALDDTFRGGLRIATGDINKDGTADLLVTAGVGGGPRVAGYDGKLLTTTQGKLFGDFFAFAPELRNGFWVTAADTDGDGFADLVVGAGTGGAPRVGVYSGQLLTGGGGTTPVTSFFAGDPDARSGVRVKALDLDNDGKAEVIAAGEAGGLPTVSIYNPLTGARRDAFYGFPTNDVSGVYVG